MKNKKLKPFVKPLIYGIAFATLLSSLILTDITNEEHDENTNYQYVNSSIITSNIPVISQEDEKNIVKPYLKDNIEISKDFYEKTLTDEEKEKAIIFYNNTYMQNSGILYKSSECFDVVSILDGTVLDVKKDEILGNIVQIKHSNNLISTYSGLKEINVKKDQLLKQGDVIGKSGNLELGESLENSLLFELIYDGKYVNPLNYYDKKLSEI